MADNNLPADVASRFELLVQSVTDYAIYMLDPPGPGHKLECRARGASRAMRPTRSSASTSPGSTRPRSVEPEIPSIALETAEREGRFEAEGWRVRKDGTRFWANVVIDPIRDTSGTLVGFAKVTRDLTRAARRRGGAARRAKQRFRLLVQSVTDYAIYMLDPKVGSAAGTPAPSASRVMPPTRSSASISPASTPTRTAPPGIPRTRLKTATRRGAVRGRGLASAQGRLALLGERHHRPDPQRRWRPDRLRQSHARPHRKARDRGAVAPIAEDGSGRPADRRPRARLQQSPDRHQRQPRDDADADGAGSNARVRPLLHRRAGRSASAPQRSPTACSRFPAARRSIRSRPTSTGC